VGANPASGRGGRRCDACLRNNQADARKAAARRKWRLVLPVVCRVLPWFDPWEVPISKSRSRQPIVTEPATARGRAARQRLVAAAETVLNRLPYGKVRVADITGEAGSAFGLFYRYFPDIKSLVIEISVQMMHQFDPVLELPTDGTDEALLHRIRAYQRINVQNHIDHPGLIRAAPELAMEDAEFRKLVRSLHIQFIEHMIGESLDGWGAAADEPAKAQRRMQVLAVQGVSLTVLQDYYVWKTTGLRHLKLAPEEMADWLSILCFRTLTGKNPDFAQFSTYEGIAPLLRLDAPFSVREAGATRAESGGAAEADH
jgi:AcrR family transcriptional regulator